MKNRFDYIKFLFSEKLTIYPILVGVLFILNESRKNFIFNSLGENALLVFTVLVFCLIVYYTSQRFITNKIKAALIASLIITINLFYQDIIFIISNQNQVMNIINLITSNQPKILIIPILLLIFLAFFFLIMKTKRLMIGVNLYLNFLLIAFIVVESAKWLMVPTSEVKLVDKGAFIVKCDLLPEQKPDIYYIILDAYTSSESLERYWKYDNSRFEDSLKQLGFTISTNSKSDYASTLFCLASYLNSSALKMDSAKHYRDQNYLELIRNNRLYDWLKANGYKCINYSLFDAFRSKKYYQYLPIHCLSRTLWYSNTIKLYHYLRPSSRISVTNLEIFEKLNKVLKRSGNSPIFTYAHIMMPHDPCSFKVTTSEFGGIRVLYEAHTSKQKYLNALIYCNDLIFKSVKNVLLNSRRKPIIIIQGDHGYRFLSDTTIIERNREAHSIFYAICSPYKLFLNDSINPQVTFKQLIDNINYSQ